MPSHNGIWKFLSIFGPALVLTGEGRTQQGLVVQNFKFAPGGYYAPPHEKQLKSLLTGAKAQPQSGGIYLITDGKFETFRETAERELLVETPQCVYEEAGDHSLHSPGPLSVQAAEGKFSIAGEGFQFQQTNSALYISNRVRTVIHPDLLQPTSASGHTNPSSSPAKGIEILSSRFDYTGDAGIGHYRADVRVTGADFTMNAGRLQFLLPLKLRQLQGLTAEDHVLFDSGDLHAQGQQATYSPDAGLIRVSGQPSWQAAFRQGRGDELEIDRTNRIFRATGHAYLKMAGQSLGATGFLPSPDPAAHDSVSATNQTVEIESGNYEIRTNSAVFRDRVFVTQRLGEQSQGQLSCGRLDATLSGTNQMDRLVAEEAVVIQQDAKRFTADRAVYSGTNGLLELTGHPAWQDGPRQGRGDVVLMDARQNELVARGNAFLRLPAEEISAASAAPATQQKTDAGGSAGAPGRSLPATNQFADISALEYRLQTNSAVFLGGVRITHPQMNLTSESVRADFPRAGGTAERILAEHSVEFDLLSDKGEKIHGTGERALYTYQASAAGTNDLVELTGNPKLIMTNGSTFENRVIILDRAQGKLIAPGKYMIHGVTEAGAVKAPETPGAKRKRK